jgi:DNA-binding transcriptional MerR regulator
LTQGGTPPRAAPGCVLYFALDTVTDLPVEIPNRAAFKASEVCEIAQIPPYVLRSWEKEFPGLGASARPGGPRIYRRSDIEQILRVKHLVFAEGLTLSGARRRIEGDPPPEIEPVLPPEPVPDEVRARVAEARRDLRSLLDMLSGPAPEGGSRPTEPAERVPQPGTEESGESADVSRAAPQQMGHDIAGAGEEESDAGLPLLEGMLDSAPRPRRTRRASKGQRG